MIMKRFFYSIIITIILLLACNLPAKPLYTSGREYPLPLPELEATIIPWLENSGYEVASFPLSMGRVQLSAAKEGVTLKFLLRPHSPLASELLIQGDAEQMFSKKQLDNLWSHLNAYIDALSIDSETQGEAIPAAVKALEQTIVCIKARSDDDDEIQVSGFLADKHGLIISTAHNLSEFHRIKVTLWNGKEFDAIIIKSNPDIDLALLHIEYVPISFISLMQGRDALDSSEILFSVSCLNNFSGAVHSGSIIGPPVNVDNQLLWKMRMKTLHGSSGSPVIDQEGNLVGVVKGRFRGSNSIGFMIPFATIIEFLNGI